MLIRRFFAFVISAFLIFFPAYSYATTSVGGWTALDTITAGATNTINAVKGAGATGMRSAVTVAASASKVGKYLIKGGGQAAIAYAMVELADGAIDWVLDPANNAIKYKTVVVDNGDLPVTGKGWQRSDSSIIYPTREAACRGMYPNNYSHYEYYTNNTIVCWRKDGDKSYSGGHAYFVNNPDYVAPDTSNDYKSIPIDTVAAQVISNAEAGHGPSQEAVKSVALEGFAAGEHDAALDAAAVPDTGVENPPDTENPPVDPAAPFDPSSIIAAINSLKAMLAGILSSMTGFFDWFQAPFTPLEEEKEEVGFATTNDVGLDDVDRFEKRITFSGQCPSNEFSFSMMGVTYAKPIPYHHLCGFLEQIAPWLLAMCYLGTAYFVVENI